MSLAPEIKAFLEAGKAAGLPDPWEAPLEVIRANTQVRLKFSGEPEKIYQVENRYFAGPSADLPVRIYRPREGSESPAIVFFYGGGWVLNFLDIYDAAMHRLANSSGATIISVNYQKAPEHPFPIPFDDCYATLMWTIENAGALGINPEKIGVGGDSAGGNLASAVALKARDNGIELAFQLLIYPCVGLDFSTESYREFETGYGLTTKLMKWFWAQYLANDQAKQNPYAVPSTAKTFNNLPPAIFITAQYDPLVTDTHNYRQQLEIAGVATTHKDFPGMIHGFFANTAITPTSIEAIDYCASEVIRLTR